MKKKKKNAKVMVNVAPEQEREEKCYEDIESLVAAVDTEIKAGKLTLMPAYRGWIDDKEIGFPDIFVRSVLFDCLVAGGFCPECANNYIEWFAAEVNDKGKKKHVLMIDRDEADVWFIAEAQDKEQMKKRRK